MTIASNFPIDPKSVRRKLGLNQQEFWSRIGVTQSGGSRYEGGRRMPKPVLELLRVVHVERIDLATVNREDFDLIQLLKTTQPQLYAGLMEKVTASQARADSPAASPVEPRIASGRTAPVARRDELDYEFSEADNDGSDDWSDDRSPRHESVIGLAAGRRR